MTQIKTKQFCSFMLRLFQHRLHCIDCKTAHQSLLFSRILLYFILIVVID